MPYYNIMFKVYVHSDSYGSDFWRSELPAKHLKVDGVELELKTSFDCKYDNDYNAYWFNRVPNPHFFPILYKLKAAGKKLLVSLDDDIWNVPAHNPAKSEFGPGTMLHMELMLDWADHILVTNEHLARQTKRPQKCTVLPNLIDTSLY